MRALLDTQAVFLWMKHPNTLPAGVDRLLSDRRNHVAVSAATFWEIAIKRARGRIEWTDAMFAAISDSAAHLLPITPAHAVRAGDLPPHHRDPFDRLLIAQAQAEGLTLVGGDGAFGAYDVRVFWA
jgi:PIN domain nuclease of toxin-antitoxin system